MTITFYLNESRKQNLYGRISNGKERAVFSLGYTVSEEMWDKKRNMLEWDDAHYFTLERLKSFLEDEALKLQAEKKDEIPSRLKIIVDELTKDDGINGISRYLFNREKAKDVPEYDSFIKAFEQYSSLSPEAYKAQIIDNNIRFHTAEGEFIVKTYEGVKAEIDHLVKENRYEELSMTDLNAWTAVFMDGLEAIGTPPIGKGKFYREMFFQWKCYWSAEYENIRASIGRTDHLKDIKEDSWRALQVLMSCYDSSTSIILDADELGEELSACAILTTLQFYNKDICLNEYCEYYFEEWDCEEVDDKFFYIQRSHE